MQRKVIVICDGQLTTAVFVTSHTLLAQLGLLAAVALLLLFRPRSAGLKNRHPRLLPTPGWQRFQ